MTDDLRLGSLLEVLEAYARELKSPSPYDYPESSVEHIIAAVKRVRAAYVAGGLIDAPRAEVTPSMLLRQYEAIEEVVQPYDALFIGGDKDKLVHGLVELWNRPLT